MSGPGRRGEDSSGLLVLGPWKGPDDLEFGTPVWVGWWNNRRLLGPIGLIPPAEAEGNYYSQNLPTEVVGTQ